MKKLKSMSIETDMDLTWLREFVRDVVIPAETADLESQEFNFSIAETLFQKGVMHLATPKEFGGQGSSVIDLAWVVRELSYGSASLGATFIGNMLGFSAPVLYASAELREKLCRTYKNENVLWSFAMSESGAGSDLAATKTVAVEDGDDFVITGEKNFITNASLSKHMSIFARLIDKFGKDQGVSCFYISGDNPGVKRGPVMDKVAWKKANTGTILFKDARIPKTNIIGEPGQGLRILTHCLNRSKTLLGAMGVGISMRALDLSQERLLSTQRYGKNLLDQSAIRHVLARLHTKAEAAWLLTCRAAATWDAGIPAVKESSMAKLFSGATASEIAMQATELFGARGLFNDYEVSKLSRDAKAIEIIEGPSLVQELLIAKEVLPRDAGKQKAKIDLFKISETDTKKGAA